MINDYNFLHDKQFKLHNCQIFSNFTIHQPQPHHPKTHTTSIWAGGWVREIVVHCWLSMKQLNGKHSDVKSAVIRCHLQMSPQMTCKLQPDSVSFALHDYLLAIYMINDYNFLHDKQFKLHNCQIFSNFTIHEPQPTLCHFHQLQGFHIFFFFHQHHSPCLDPVSVTFPHLVWNLILLHHSSLAFPY